MTANWKQMKEEYVAGGTTYRQLSEKYGVPMGVIAYRAKEEKWRDLRVAHAEDDLDASADLAAIADKLTVRISELLDIMILDTHGIKQISSALKDLRDVKEYRSDVALRKAKLRKLEREVERAEESVSDGISVIFDAGEEDWNE